MADFNIYPAVDEGYNFPSVILQAMIASPEFRQALQSAGGGGGGGGGSVVRVRVVNGQESRPAIETVIWLGGKTRPTNMINGDIWLKEEEAALPTPPLILTTAMSGMTTNVAYQIALEASGSDPKTWTVSAGVLPTGLALNGSTGVISGTPTGSGAYSFTIAATNAQGTDTQAFSGTISSTLPVPNIGPASLNAMQAGSSFTQNLTNTGGAIATVTTSGTVPGGLSVALVGGVIRVSGTPTSAGAYSFNIIATNATGSDTQPYSGTIAAAGTGGGLSIFGGSVPYSGITRQTDAAPGIEVASGFYTAAGAEGYKLRKVKVYIPGSISPGAIPIKVYMPATGSAPAIGGGSEVATGTISSPVAGQWNEATLNVPVELIPGRPVWVSYNAGGGVYYAASGVMPNPAVQAPNSVPLYYADDIPYPTLGRNYFRIGTGASTQGPPATWYGLDVEVTTT